MLSPQCHSSRDGGCGTRLPVISQDIHGMRGHSVWGGRDLQAFHRSMFQSKVFQGSKTNKTQKQQGHLKGTKSMPVTGPCSSSKPLSLCCGHRSQGPGYSKALMPSAWAGLRWRVKPVLGGVSRTSHLARAGSPYTPPASPSSLSAHRS
jgi:hypothetical protein